MTCEQVGTKDVPVGRAMQTPPEQRLINIALNSAFTWTWDDTVDETAVTFRPDRSADRPAAPYARPMLGPERSVGPSVEDSVGPSVEDSVRHNVVDEPRPTRTAAFFDLDKTI